MNVQLAVTSSSLFAASTTSKWSMTALPKNAVLLFPASGNHLRPTSKVAAFTPPINKITPQLALLACGVIYY
jgi:hypothetical protein